jgi:hypothetical protein
MLLATALCSTAGGATVTDATMVGQQNTSNAFTDAVHAPQQVLLRTTMAMLLCAGAKN